MPWWLELLHWLSEHWLVVWEPHPFRRILGLGECSALGQWHWVEKLGRCHVFCSLHPKAALFSLFWVPGAQPVRVLDREDMGISGFSLNLSNQGWVALYIYLDKKYVYFCLIPSPFSPSPPASSPLTAVQTIYDHCTTFVTSKLWKQLKCPSVNYQVLHANRNNGTDLHVKEILLSDLHFPCISMPCQRI